MTEKFLSDDETNLLTSSIYFENPEISIKIIEELNCKHVTSAELLNEILIYNIKFLNLTGKYNLALDLAKPLLKKVENNGNALMEFQTIIGLIEALEPLNKLKECFKLCERGNNLVKSFIEIRITKILKIKAQFFLDHGIVLHKNYQFDQSLVYLKKSLKIMESLDDKLGISEVYQHIGLVFHLSSNPQEAIRNYNLSIEFGMKFKPNMILAWTYAHKAWTLYFSGNLENILSYTDKSLKISHFFQNSHSEDFISLINGRYYTRIGDLAQAIQFLLRSYELRKSRGNLLEISYALVDLAEIYSDMGELEIVSQYLDQAMEIPNTLEDPLAAIQYNMEKGKLLAERGFTYEALIHLENVSELFKKRNLDLQKTRYYHILISISLRLNNFKKANSYLFLLNELAQKNKENRFIQQSYLLDRSIILKNNPRISKKMESFFLFKELLQIGEKESQIAIEARINLLELLILELEISDDEKEIFDEIKENLENLLIIAKKQNCYSLLCETLFFQAKLALIEKNFSYAQELLTKAQFIADNKGYKRLAIKISDVHDKILFQVDEWSDKNSNLIPIKEIMKTTQFEFQFSKVLRKFEKENISSGENEIPSFILLWAESGLEIFSYYFNEKDDEIKKSMLPNLLYAYDLFGQETFNSSSSIDRIKLGDNIIVFRKIDHIGIAYGFKGKSFYAIKRLDKFLDLLRNSGDNWTDILHARINNQHINKSNYSQIVSLINSFFHSN